MSWSGSDWCRRDRLCVSVIGLVLCHWSLFVDVLADRQGCGSLHGQAHLAGWLIFSGECAGDCGADLHGKHCPTGGHCVRHVCEFAMASILGWVLLTRWTVETLMYVVCLLEAAGPCTLFTDWPQLGPWSLPQPNDTFGVRHCHHLRRWQWSGRGVSVGTQR